MPVTALDRFVDAQSTVYNTVLAELRAGDKRTHWMWFVFPQIAGLGHSPIAQRFAIADLDEARAYLAHPVLGARLRECAQLISDVEGRSIDRILGFPDNLKLRSSMTLFAQASTDNAVFLAVLQKYFDGEADPRTLEILGRG
ncbi:DUF1810 domain-containing protein [Antrihabitans sp. YC2-6]|uniref:DUF1810 domain-containing protein n=1 Tax=Antrihabitans sp. YC2-6 TaxID=2799498 RepID=UPI0018F750F1|nr:DUF1810 domain-containing protein [Antrihabitans sp. YC2-6]MBJ8348966.1 DUF1810 domain-containing protein [Antrihabitans sp. YC2-6]